MLPCVCSVIDHRWRQNAVRTNKCTRGVAECVTDVLTTFWRLLWSITESDARQHGIYLFYIITKSLLYFKIFQHDAKAGLLPRLCPAFILHEKKPFDVIYDRFKMKQFHWLLCVTKNRDWWRKSRHCQTWLERRSLLNENLYSESRIDLRNLQILKKMLEKSSQFLSPEQPCEPTSLDVALKITGGEKIPSKNLWLRST